MEQEKFEQLLSEVCEWQRKPYQLEHADAKSKDQIIPTQIVVKKLKDRACPYDPNNKNCQVYIKRIDYLGFYYKHCRTCRSLVYDDQLYPAKGVTNIVAFYHKIIKDNK